MHRANKKMFEPGWHPQGLRVKRGILVGRRASPTTPVPSWKVFDNQLYDGIAAAGTARAAIRRATPVSARKLAASLWELQDHPLPACLCSQHWLKGISDNSSPRSQADSYFSPRSCKFAYQQYVKTGAENDKRGEDFGKHLAAMSMHVHHSEKGEKPDYHVTYAPIQIEGQSHQFSPAYSNCSSHRKCNRKAVDDSTTTSSELLKVLSRIRILEEQHNSSLSLTSTLRAELEQARARVHDLEKTQKAARREVESIMKKMIDVKASWKVKEQEKMQEKIAIGVQAVKDELEDERKVRHRLEISNLRMTKELVEVKMAAGKALEQLENERRTRQLMEDVCDELAREIGQGKLEKEEFIRQSERVRDELEEERRMLQLAEVWREERVRMKLIEAKVALEEKGAALDFMRGELEAFLRCQKGNGRNPALKEAQVLRNVITAMHPSRLIASFPSIALNQEPSSDNDVYTVNLSAEDQLTSDEALEDRYRGNLLDSQDTANRWEDSEGDMVEANYDARIFSSANVHVRRRNSHKWHAEGTNEGESDFVSESHDSEKEDTHEVACEEFPWNGYYEDDLRLGNDGIVHAPDPQDSVDEYSLTDEDIEALSRPNGHHVEVVWGEGAFDDVQANCFALRRDDDALDQHHSSKRLLNEHVNHLMSDSSPHQKPQQLQSPDKASNTHIIRGMKGHMKWPRNIDVVMRSKLLESNLERQQLRHR